MNDILSETVVFSTDFSVEFGLFHYILAFADGCRTAAE
jgi:hypothetical protein